MICPGSATQVVVARTFDVLGPRFEPWIPHLIFATRLFETKIKKIPTM